MLFTHNGKRSVHAHAGCRLYPVASHRKNHLVYIFVVPAKGTVKNITLVQCMNRNFLVRNFKIGKMNKIHIQPLSVRIKRSVLIFAFFITDNLFLKSINKKYATRLKSWFYFDVFFRNIKHTNFRTQNQHTVLCDVVAAWAKSVTIKGCTKQITVTEKNCRRSVPAFHHSCPIMIKILFLLSHIVIMFPWFRNTSHNSKR